MTQFLSPLLAQSSVDNVEWFTMTRDSMARRLDMLAQPDDLLPILENVGLLWTFLFVGLGAVCLINGHRWHKYVIVAIAALAGIWTGIAISDQLGPRVIVATCTAVLFGLLSWPLLRYSVALFGGLAGAFAGANLWTASGVSEGSWQIGAVVGLILVGMLAFLAFRLVVVVLTAIVGATLLSFGLMAGLMQLSDSWRGTITESVSSNPRLVPLLVASGATVGIIVQLGGGFKGLAAKANSADPKGAKKAKPA